MAQAKLFEYKIDEAIHPPGEVLKQSVIIAAYPRNNRCIRNSQHIQENMDQFKQVFTYYYEE